MVDNISNKLPYKGPPPMRTAVVGRCRKMLFNNVSVSIGGSFIPSRLLFDDDVDGRVVVIVQKKPPGMKDGSHDKPFLFIRNCQPNIGEDIVSVADKFLKKRKLVVGPSVAIDS